ncbi:MAG TPA: hypothetical protein VFQ79_16535 [Bryobacteraceae bacterium]|nr:hypothetical protein [Bryobacteraceae bacterium]
MPAHTTQFERLESYEIAPQGWTHARNSIALLTAVGVAASAAAYAADAPRFFASWLVSFAFFVSIGLGALFFVMVQHLTGAAWSVTLRRLMENCAGTLPASILLFVPVVFGFNDLYKWSNAAAVSPDSILLGKSAYLNPSFFLLRSALYFAIWGLWAWKLRAISAKQDRTGSIETVRDGARWSAPGVILLILTGTLASFDWIMSLDPHWYSTIFGIYFLSGGALAFIAALILIALAFRRAGILRYAITVEHYHDLGKWLFALTIFWAYIAFSQYLLIWYANIPEETIWFRHRLEGSWTWMSAALLIGHFMVPFLVLLPSSSKRNLKILGLMSAWILAAHFIDLYWQIMPNFHAHRVEFHWADAATFAASGGIVSWVFWTGTRARPAVPVGDPRLEKSLEFENA